MDFYWHYSSKEVVDQSVSFELISKIIAVTNKFIDLHSDSIVIL